MLEECSPWEDLQEERVTECSGLAACVRCSCLISRTLRKVVSSLNQQFHQGQFFVCFCVSGSDLGVSDVERSGFSGGSLKVVAEGTVTARVPKLSEELAFGLVIRLPQFYPLLAA